MASVNHAGSVPHNALLAVIWSSFGVAFMFVALRAIIRLRVAHRMTVEDYWIYLALVTLLTFCILETVQLPSLFYLTSTIAGDIPLSTSVIQYTEDYLRFEFPIILLYWTVIWSVKANFLALYFNLFRELPIYRRFWYALSIFTVLAYIGCLVTLCLSCYPTSNFFKFAGCATWRDIWASNFSVYYSTAVDIITDLCIMAMPIRMIYNVKISPKQKAGLICIFGLGFVMIAFAITRAKQVLVEQYFVNLTLLMIWSTLAASVSVIIGSLPTLKILISTNRASGKRSGMGSSFGSRHHNDSDTDMRIKSVPLSPASNAQPQLSTRPNAEKSDSQVHILQPPEANLDQSPSIVSNRPQPIYHHGPPVVIEYGKAF